MDPITCLPLFFVVYSGNDVTDHGFQWALLYIFPSCKRSQSAADVRRRARSRTPCTPRARQHSRCGAL